MIASTAVSSNHEEAGHGGTIGIPDGVVELVTVDMAAAVDEQYSDEFAERVMLTSGLARRLDQHIPRTALA